MREVYHHVSCILTTIYTYTTYICTVYFLCTQFYCAYIFLVEICELYYYDMVFLSSYAL